MATLTLSAPLLNLIASIPFQLPPWIKDFNAEPASFLQQFLPLVRDRRFDADAILSHKFPHPVPAVMNHLRAQQKKQPYTSLQPFKLDYLRFVASSDPQTFARESFHILTSFPPITSPAELRTFLQTFGYRHPYLAFMNYSFILTYVFNYGALSLLHHSSAVHSIAESCTDFADFCTLLSTDKLSLLFRHCFPRMQDKKYQKPDQQSKFKQTHRSLPQPSPTSGYHVSTSDPSDAHLPHHPITFELSNQTLDALCDTCSSTSIISRNLDDQLSGTTFLDPDQPMVQLSTACQDPVSPNYRVQFTFILAGLEKLFTRTFFVTPKPDLLILGWDFFSTHGFSVPLDISPPVADPTALQISSLLSQYDPGPICLPPSREADYRFVLEKPLFSEV